MKKITPRLLRTTLQGGMTLFCLFIGYRFYQFYLWATGATDIFVKKPGAVEGFLPISALLGLKRLLTDRVYDEIHPAGLTIFIAIIVMSIIFRKGFCGHLCPVGFLHNLTNKIGKKLKLTKQVTGKLGIILLIPKYVLMTFFLFGIIFKMNSAQINGFIRSSFNITSDAKMLEFFLHPGLTAGLIIAGIILLSIFIPYFWCRFLCPYGALLGLIAKLSPVAIKRETALCIHCSKCVKACPAGIEVEKKEIINSPECIGCTECISACPVQGCMNVIDRLSKKPIPYATIGIGCLCVLLIYYTAAKFTGHWDSTIPHEMLRRYYMLH